jgi:hypothetical protein
LVLDALRRKYLLNMVFAVLAIQVGYSIQKLVKVSYQKQLSRLNLSAIKKKNKAIKESYSSYFHTYKG